MRVKGRKEEIGEKWKERRERGKEEGAREEMRKR